MLYSWSSQPCRAFCDQGDTCSGYQSSTGASACRAPWPARLASWVVAPLSSSAVADSADDAAAAGAAAARGDGSAPICCGFCIPADRNWPRDSSSPGDWDRCGNVDDCRHQKHCRV